MIPREDVIELEMSVAEGMKLVISAGAVVPPFPAETMSQGGWPDRAQD